MQFDGRSTKVLVVDNDRTTLEMVQIRLDVAGFQAFGARSAQAALEVLGNSRFDAIILERDLPGIDGMAFLEAMKHLQDRRPVPVLLVGRALAADDVRKAVGLGVRDCLAKPFSGAAVLERLGRMLRKTAGAPAAAGAQRGVVYLSA
ncbi:MAG: response regulator [Caulobacterales bacterium]|nr:response regulator [Caulobacterales bacterium]